MNRQGLTITFNRQIPKPQFQEEYSLFNSVLGRALSLLPRDVAQCCEASTMTSRQLRGRQQERILEECLCLINGSCSELFGPVIRGSP